MIVHVLTYAALAIIVFNLAVVVWVAAVETCDWRRHRADDRFARSHKAHR